MKFNFLPMNKEYADTIAFCWKYDGQYSFYDMTEDQDDLNEFLNPENWTDRIFAVTDDQDGLVGFFQYDIEDCRMDIGLGLKPELTGKGIGGSFVTAGIDFGIKRFGTEICRVTLSVASFNTRAINLYKKLGFIVTGLSMVTTNGGEYEFINMTKEL